MQDNNIAMHSRHNEAFITFVTKTFIRNVKNKISICMTSISKNVDADELDDIVNKYNNALYSTIKMEPANVK